MKKNLFKILAALAVLALVMTACPTDGGGGGKGPGPGEKNDVRLLSSIAIGATSQSAGAGAHRKDTLDGLSPKDFDLPSASAAGQLEVTLTFAEDFNGTAKIAKAAEGTAITEASFTAYSASSKPKYTFADGDLLYVKVTASDGVSVYYYGYTVLIGSGTSLDTVNFVSAANQPLAAEDVSVTLGDSKDSATATFSLEETGKIQFNVIGTSFKVNVLANDTETTVKINKDGGTSWLDNGSSLNFTEADTLYVFVTSANGKVKKYYKFAVILQRSVTIAYGAPTNLTIASDGTVDAIWADTHALWATKEDKGWLQINRVNTTETQDIVSITNKRTYGRAKLLWDEGGVYIYAQVWEENITFADGPSDSAYTKSSVELFINESGGRTGTVASSVNTNGGQYRLGANNVRSGPQTNQTDAFNGLGKSDARAWTSSDFPYTNDKAPTEGAGITNGYAVMFQAPWLFPDLYPLVDNKVITLELQINATNPAGGDGRVGVLNWNNANSNSYSSVANFGGGTLALNGNTLGALGASITTQPKNQSIKVGSDTTVNALTVAATSPDNGTLTFEWFKANSAIDVGTSVGTGTATATDSTYTPTIDTTTEGKYYFYAVVTNTVAGGKTSTRKSNVALISVYAPVVATGDVELLPVEPIIFTLVEGYATVANLPFKVDLADYTKLEIWYTVPTPSASQTQYNNDFFVEFTGSDGAAPADIGYNASAVLKDDADNFAGLSFNLAASHQALTGGGSAKVEIKNKDGGSNKTQEATITSVKLLKADGTGIELLPVEPKKFTLVEGYATVANLPFAVDLAGFAKLEIWYTVPTPSASQTQYNNDFFVEFTGSDGAAPADIGYNASAVLKDDADNFAGLSFNLAASHQALTGGGSAKVEIKNKDGGSNKTQEATITSVKLIKAP